MIEEEKYSADFILYCFNGVASNDLFEVRRETCLII